MKPLPIDSHDTQGQRPGISNAAFITLVIITAIVPLILLVAPAAASQLATEMKLSPSQIGTYFFFELGAFSLGTLPSYLWLHRIDGRRVALVSALILCLGNFATAYLVTGFVSLLVFRAITALAAGTLNVLCMMTAAKAENPDRVFGICIVGQLVVGAVGLWIFPGLFATFGISALYVGMGLLAVAIIFVARNFPDFMQKPQLAANSLNREEAVPSSALIPVLVVASVFLFYIAMGGVWTFVHNSADAAGLDATTAGRVMSIATIMGVIGAAVASFLGGKVNRTLVLWVGYAAMVLSIVGLAFKGGPAEFTAAVFLFKFGWTFVLPFIFAAAASVSSSRLFGSLSLFVGGGLAIGPLIGGYLIQATGSTATLYWSGAVVTAISALMLNRIAAIGKSRQLSGQPSFQNQ